MPENKNQLHQLLAVESDLRSKAAKILVETKTTFLKKQEHFDGFVRSYEPFEVSDEKKMTQIAPEIKGVVTTVDSKLRYTQASLTQAIDAQLSKEETNASGTAKAVLEIGGISFGEFSAPSLLALEGILVRVRDVYNTIPTLDPVKNWGEDGSQKNIFVTSDYETFRTEKTPRVITLAPATEQHPAQTQLMNVDQQVGKFTVRYSSGRITPKQKSDYLGRIDILIIAVKKARSKANQAGVVGIKVGNKLFSFIDTGI